MKWRPAFVTSLGLVFAVALSSLSPGLETLAASLLVGAAVLQAASAIANLVQGIPDQFVQRRLGYQLAAANAVHECDPV